MTTIGPDFQSPLRDRSIYSVTKGGINAFTRELAVEWAQHKIRVNALQLPQRAVVHLG